MIEPEQDRFSTLKAGLVFLTRVRSGVAFWLLWPTLERMVSGNPLSTFTERTRFMGIVLGGLA